MHLELWLVVYTPFLVLCRLSSFSVFESYVKTRKRGILQAMSGNQIAKKPIKSELHSLYLLSVNNYIADDHMLIVYSIPMNNEQ